MILLRSAERLRCLQSGGILPDGKFAVEQSFGGWTQAGDMVRLMPSTWEKLAKACQYTGVTL